MPARRRKGQEIPPLEWIAGGLGVLVVAATLAFIALESYRGESDGPDLQAEVDSVNAGSGGYEVGVIVRNAGRTAARGVIVEGMSSDGRGRESRVQAELDYVPGLSQERATLIFPDRPDRAAVRVRIVSFTTP
jgi:uncharacterized protein (TIGR02588 family)